MADSTQSQTTGREIPTKRVMLNDINQLPNEYSTTPGGTMFSTTPGGTRIVYDRTFLLKCRSSPLARTPPKNLPNIPGVTKPGDVKPDENGDAEEEKAKPAPVDAEHPQFEMDI